MSHLCLNTVKSHLYTLSETVGQLPQPNNCEPSCRGVLMSSQLNITIYGTYLVLVLGPRVTQKVTQSWCRFDSIPQVNRFLTTSVLAHFVEFAMIRAESDSST
jgi:hypothetical protein